MPANRDTLLALGGADRRFSYAKRDTLLYALGCGLGSDPCDPRQLRFTYEKDLLAFPTLVCVLTAGFDTLAGSGVDYAQVVHAEQRLQIHAPLPAEGEVTARWAVDEVVDKGPGRGALITHHVKITDADGTPLATVHRTTLARGDGGLGGPTASRFVLTPVPDRPPDRKVTVETLPQQALLYRLNGDFNPLHADPEAARRAGFHRPILHGLGSFAIACRVVLETWCDLDPARLRAFEVRFAAPVMPGESLLLRMWRDSESSTVAFEADVPERGVTALRSGRAVIA